MPTLHLPMTGPKWRLAAEVQVFANSQAGVGDALPADAAQTSEQAHANGNSAVC